jgi:ubiquinone/menaquinone biosynthesis C-methylase UbiE
MTDPQEQRAESQQRWNRAAEGWARQASRLREQTIHVSEWLVDHLALEPGITLLELAAGPGDTGFLAAAQIAPGKLISSDANEAMSQLARTRAREQGIENVEFKELQLEWIDMPTASVDRVLCRWGVMLVVDPAAAASEIRRVLRPGGRAALAVWDAAEHNPWATTPNRALIELGHAEPPDPSQPGMFSLDSADKLRGLLEAAGFLDILIEAVDVDHDYDDLDHLVADTLDCSRMFADVWDTLSEPQRHELTERISSLAEPYRTANGSLHLPGRTLVAAASA